MYFKEIVDQKIKDHMPELEVITMNHDSDHVHIQISIPPKIRISDFVRTIKSITGRLLKKRFEYMRKAYWKSDGIWLDGYFISFSKPDNSLLSLKKYQRHKHVSLSSSDVI